MSRTQRWRDRREAWRSTAEVFHPAGFAVDVIERTPAARFVEQHHYSGSYVASRLQVGLFEGRALVGVAAFSVGVQPRAMERWLGVAPAEGIELGRLVLLDQVGANAETWFIARAMRLLRAELPEVRALLSYADPVPRYTAAGVQVTPGHVGIVYQASNAAYLGRSSARTVWMDAHGRLLSPRTLAKVQRGERGCGGAVDGLVAAGAPSPRLGEDLAAWLRRALQEGPFKRLRHPGCHAYAWRLAEGAAIAPSGRYPKPAVSMSAPRSSAVPNRDAA